ncbi:hypothetical protein RAH32_06255 [Paracoccus sp. WLY502]|uniref:hypothetical protein n=1 Tax=Paracoccus yibinensis TaxID=3068891 RepID=UPI00279663A6|nr:hypothetical protein [Paracoccus sp. WLY502]MDQ1900043.1 hypothetical protein [Paracoccus sp. WLY502]
MRMIDFSNWNSILSTVIGIALFALIGIGIRVLVMFTVQQRRERMNRQINERLRVLIAAYKMLGGSFTGDLAVDPAHLRDLRQRAMDEGADLTEGSDRRRRIRDAVEAALSDILLLGTETHVRLAERAARDLVEGRPVQTDELVRSLRDFIRTALDLEPVPAGLAIPPQGPTRPAPGGGKGRDEGRSRGGGGGGAGAGGGGGMGMGMAAGRHADDPATGA